MGSDPKCDVMKRPEGELCKVQFMKTITVVGKVQHDSKTNKYHIEGVDKKSGQPVNSWVDASMIQLIEDANEWETRKFGESYASSLGKRPENR